MEFFEKAFQNVDPDTLIKIKKVVELMMAGNDNEVIFYVSKNFTENDYEIINKITEVLSLLRQVSK